MPNKGTARKEASQTWAENYPKQEVKVSLQISQLAVTGNACRFQCGNILVLFYKKYQLAYKHVLLIIVKM